MDKHIGVENRLKRATFAVVDRHCEASRIAHSLQQQLVYSSITERRHVLRLIFQDESLLLLVVPSGALFRKCSLMGSRASSRRAVPKVSTVRTVQLDPPRKSAEAGSDTPPTTPLKECVPV